MNLNSIYTLAFALLITSNAFAGNPHVPVISQHIKDKNIEGVYKEFAQWQKEDPNSPNIADTWAWYFFNAAYSQGWKIDSVKPEGVEDYMAILGKGEKKEFVYAEVNINCDSLKKGLDILDNEMNRHPDCIDLYFTKNEILLTLMEKCSHKSSADDAIKIHYERENLSQDEYINSLMEKALIHPTVIGDKAVIADLANDAVKNLNRLLNRSIENGNLWYDLFDQKVENGEALMLEKLQSSFLFLLQNAEYDKASLYNDRLLSLYPKRFDFRTNQALIAMSRKDFDSALKLLEVLHKDFPKDDIISADLAEVYFITGKTKQAKKIFKMLLKSANAEVARMAKLRLEKL